MTEKAAIAADRLPIEGQLPSLDGAVAWLNGPPVTAAELRGKVVLIDFWTYSCINWMRTEPYVRAWADTYRDQGLVVIGVHTPEFEFEKNIDNVRWAAGAYRVNYPIAVDSDHAVWRAFNNRYWPALYLVDAQGRIRYHQFGEGGYEGSEEAIRELLTEAGTSAITDAPAAVEAGGVEAPPDIGSLASPETYVGYDRGEKLVSFDSVVPNGPALYSIPMQLRLNHWALAGRWNVGGESTTLEEANGRIAFRFHARDLHLVMGPAAQGITVRFRVRIDGEAPGPNRGLDVDEEGNGLVTEQRLYQLIRQRKPIADRTFEIDFLDPGVEAFVFTFG